jgi:hypothetical protein
VESEEPRSSTGQCKDRRKVNLTRKGLIRTRTRKRSMAKGELYTMSFGITDRLIEDVYCLPPVYVAVSPKNKVL